MDEQTGWTGWIAFAGIMLVIGGSLNLFWGLIASMWIGNLMLLILNLPLIGLWIKMLTMPYRLLYPSILVFMAIGVYAWVDNDMSAERVGRAIDRSAVAITADAGEAIEEAGGRAAVLCLGHVQGIRRPGGQDRRCCQRAARHAQVHLHR